MTSNKLPKELGIKIGTKQERFWTQVKEMATRVTEESKQQIMLQTEIIKIAEEKIKTEQKLMKKP